MNDAQEADCESPLKEEKWEKSMVLQSSIYLVILTMRSNQDARTKSMSLFKKFYVVSKKESVAILGYVAIMVQQIFTIKVKWQLLLVLSSFDNIM